MVEEFSAEDLASELEGFGALLHDCVHAGASVGFILPFVQSEAVAFWRDKVLPAMAGRILFAVRDGARLVGTVSLVHDMPPNQPHRADVAKMLVHPDMRRRGIARGLMAAVEERARLMGKTLLVLDTRTGDVAEPLYLSCGFDVAGVIPGYCLDPSGVGVDATTYMYKALT